jgi:hypothetical protein
MTFNRGENIVQKNCSRGAPKSKDELTTLEEVGGVKLVSI